MPSLFSLCVSCVQCTDGHPAFPSLTQFSWCRQAALHRHVITTRSAVPESMQMHFVGSWHASVAAYSHFYLSCQGHWPSRCNFLEQLMQLGSRQGLRGLVFTGLGLLFCCAMTRQGLLRTSICIRTCSCLQQCFVAPMGNANVSSTAASYVISCGSHVEPKKARPPQDCHCILYYETNVKLHLHMGGQDALYQVLACCAYTSRCRRPSPGPLLDDCCEAQPGLCF